MMHDTTEKENEMVLAAGKNGGEYLDDIKKYDLRTLNKDEWSQFLRSVIGRWTELRLQQSHHDDMNDEIPF